MAPVQGWQILPSYGLDSLAAVLPAAGGALGARFTTATGLDSLACREALALPEAEHVVVVLCDGLGLNILAERVGHSPFLRRRMDAAKGLVTSFPATTTAALSTFGTGTAPGCTGLAGYTLRDPDTGALANIVSWTQQEDPTQVTDNDAQRSAPRLDRAPEELQREQTVFERLAAESVGVTSFGKAKFYGSGLTQATLRGGEFVAVANKRDRVDAVVRTLRRKRGQRHLAYLYWGELDKAGHGHGWTSAEWSHELEVFDGELARIARSVAPGTLIVLTADHGHVLADPSDRVDVAATPRLSEGVALIAGEPRAVHVHAEPGETDAVAERWRAELAGRAEVLTRDQAVAAGWFGPVAEHVAPWIGDLVVAPAGRFTIVDSRTQTPTSLTLPGVHGSLTDDEMIVPLIAELT